MCMGEIFIENNKQGTYFFHELYPNRFYIFMGITLTPFKKGFTQAFFVEKYLAVGVVTDYIALSFRSHMPV